MEPSASDKDIKETRMSSPQATELKTYLPPADLVKIAAVSGMQGYNALCAEAEKDYEGYWARLARELITWKVPFTQVLNSSQAPLFKWFEDGKLNASYNCLDRNVERGLGDKTALIFEADGGEVTQVTYKQLLARTCEIANGLKSLGIKKGDRVIIYISMSVEGVAAMQALRLTLVRRSSSMMPSLTVCVGNPRICSTRPNNSSAKATSAGPCILGLTM